MIFGNGILQLIAAKNLPGYDDFIDSSFTKDFNHEEELEIFYPPDHPSAGTKYSFDGSGQETTTFGNFLSEKRRTEKKEDELLSFRKDFFYPYQSEISFRVNPINTRPFPVNQEGSPEFDGFLLEGSVVVGIQSGAKRFYAGPFMGTNGRWSNRQSCFLFQFLWKNSPNNTNIDGIARLCIQTDVGCNRICE
jgi:hypothetical protein